MLHAVGRRFLLEDGIVEWNPSWASCSFMVEPSVINEVGINYNWDLQWRRRGYTNGI